VDKLFPVWTVVSLLAARARSAASSAGPVGVLTASSGRHRPGRRAAHVTWSVNSICHMIGERPFAARDKSANFWPLAILSFGESCTTCTTPTHLGRHGVQRGQIDISARTIWVFEKLAGRGNVRWPSPQRLARISAAK